jgi:hypothetical protein
VITFTRSIARPKELAKSKGDVENISFTIGFSYDRRKNSSSLHEKTMQLILASISKIRFVHPEKMSKKAPIGTH